MQPEHTGLSTTKLRDFNAVKAGFYILRKLNSENPVLTSLSVTTLRRIHADGTPMEGRKPERAAIRAAMQFLIQEKFITETALEVPGQSKSDTVFEYSITDEGRAQLAQYEQIGLENIVPVRKR
jgi:hypothetical protein